MKKLIIFGFDGTLADTSPGILHCFNTTATSMGFNPVDRKSMYGIIGFPLEAGLRKLFDMNDGEIEYAINNYSKLYSMKGKEMFYLYSGIEETLYKLKEDGYLLAVATQKHDMYTRDMLKTYKIEDLFDAICATDVGKDLYKSNLLRMACEKLGVLPEESIFLGDNYVDAQGAEEVGMDFAAVLYGWGFRTKAEAQQYNCRLYIENSDDIYNMIKTL
ncbi:MAG: HAD hydrolase-like protein [Ruminococcus sp.]|nr:HAD hydrolase-like protein [Ruminococcus sp.]